MSQSSFSKLLSVKQATISQVENSKINPSLDLIINIAYNFEDVNREWLLTGDGPMLKQELALIDQVTKDSLIYSTQYDGIPVVNLESSAGLLASQDHPTDEVAYYIPKFGDLRHIDNAAGFEVKGMSMLPTIQSGDLIIASRLMTIRDIKPNYIYVVHSSILIGETQSNIKRVGVSADGTKLTLKSDNRVYAPITIDTEEVIAIWQVRRRITGKFMNPADFEHRLSALENRIWHIENKSLNP